MKYFLLLIFTLCLFPISTWAAQSNNIYGIHLAQPHFEDLKNAAELVNSSGGDWGYITLVIQENDRDLKKWQEIFDQLRKLHLIPIIRLATVPEGQSWRRPSKDSAKTWADFLDSLNWVVKNRYVILFNEPNHASEWGGAVDPQDYAWVAFEFVHTLKKKNPDFFVMLAGLDASAPSSPPNFEDEEVFLRQIIKSEINSNDQNVQKVLNESNFKNCFEFRISCFEFLIDGWASHSYPNPDFSGTAWDFGRGTVRTYQWELELLKSLGIKKDLPVFITETGWKRKSQNYFDEDRVADNFKIAFEQVWLPDERVTAVTPFVLDYQSEPFLGFSWKKIQSNEFYPQYYVIQSLPKIKGEPERVEKGEINFNLPKELVAQSTYQLEIKLKNLGQAIWDKDDGYSLSLIGSRQEEKPFDYLFSDLKNIKPFEEEEVNLFLKTGKLTSPPDNYFNSKVKFFLMRNEKKILESKDWQFKIIPLPSLKFSVQLFPKLIESGDDFEIQIFDEKENLVFKKNKLKVKSAVGKLDDIQNIIPGKRYRLVVLKPYYLPRQNFIVFKKGENKINFKSMIPLDFNKDGKFSFSDLKTLVKTPQLLRLFFP